jgi:hypothetical protein
MSQGPKRAPSASYTGNASTTVFAVTFPFLNATDLIVSVAGVVKTLTTHYTVSGGLGSPGSVTFLSAPANAAAIVISTVYSADTSNAILRRWEDLGNPIDGPLAREGGTSGTITNQVSTKRNVASKTGNAVAVAGGVFPNG